MEPDVESGEGVHIGDCDMLAGVEDLVLVVVGLGDIQSDEWRVWFVVFKIHLALEWVDIGLDASVRCDCGVDGHQVGIALSLEDIDALDV